MMASPVPRAKTRAPSNLGASLVTLPRAQEIVGGIGARLAVNARLIDSFAGDFDDALTKFRFALNRLAGFATALSGFPGASRGGLIEHLDGDVGAGVIGVC